MVFMNYFSYWSDQIAPYAIMAEPFMDLVLYGSFIIYWVIVFTIEKKRKPESIDWKKIPFALVMLIYTFQWAFIPEEATVLGNILVGVFIFVSLLWLKEHYRPIPEEENTSEKNKSS